MRKITIKDMHELAREHKGRCLSKEYLGDRVNLHWMCKEGHKWWATPSNVKRGTWCKICYHKKSSDLQRGELKEYKRIAREKGLILNSKTYINAQQTSDLGCKKCGYIFHSTFGALKHRLKGCPKCQGRVKLTYKEECRRAKEKNIKVLSPERDFKGSSGKLLYKCFHKKHKRFLSTPNDMQQGKGCPRCSKHFLLAKEEMCLEFLENFFGEKFESHKQFFWLTTTRGNKMHLDGYCEKLNIAFERQGESHDKESSWHTSPNSTRSFQQQQHDDRRKRELCKEHGIKLIEIHHSREPSQLQDFLIKFCDNAENKIVFPDKWRIKKIKYLEFTDYAAFCKGKIKEAQRWAKKRRGKCISKEWDNGHAYLLWKCKRKQHPVFKATFHNVKAGTAWCPLCRYITVAEKKRYKPDFVYRFIKSKGYKPLSKYKGCRIPMKLKCPVENHRPIKINWNSFQQGGRCRKCQGKKSSARQRLSKQEVERRLKESKVTLLSKYEDFKNCKSRGDLECLRCGKIFNANLFNYLYPKSIARGCKECKINERTAKKRLDINDVKKEAENIGWYFLSDTYKNNQTTYDFKCMKCGDIRWFTYGNLIKRRYKCRECKK